MPQRVRRFALVGFTMFILLIVVATSAVAALLTSNGGGLMGIAGLVTAVLAVLATMVVFGVTAIRLRRWATPVADLMEATERVAGGDLTARVRPQGRPEMRRMIATFNAMAERLGASEEQRRRLLADVTHELRTPLTVLEGGLEAMLDGVHERTDERLHSLIEETKRMERLIDDLRTLAVAQAGTLALKREPVPPDELVDEAVAALGGVADTAGVDLVTTTTPGLPRVGADPVRIHQVLTNLLTNAIRHAPAGSPVTVAVVNAEGGTVRFEVVDAGPGIPADETDQIFERFHTGATSSREGSGLGLAIARDLVEAHGGTIGVERPAAGGARFWFELPVWGDR